MIVDERRAGMLDRPADHASGFESLRHAVNIKGCFDHLEFRARHGRALSRPSTSSAGREDLDARA
jgi:hypothetical protein